MALCNDDEVDDVLLAILFPIKSKERKQPPPYLAAFCLADEPHVDDSTARAVIDAIVRDATESLKHEISGDAVVELGGSSYGEMLRDELIVAYTSAADEGTAMRYGSLFATSARTGLRIVSEELDKETLRLTEAISSGEVTQASAAALQVMEAAFMKRSTRFARRPSTSGLGICLGTDMAE